MYADLSVGVPVPIRFQAAASMGVEGEGVEGVGGSECGGGGGKRRRGWTGRWVWREVERSKRGRGRVAGGERVVIRGGVMVGRGRV